jgi:hypothetical protein
LFILCISSNNDFLHGRGKCKLYGKDMLCQLVGESVTKFDECPDEKSSIVVDEIISKMRSAHPPIRAKVAQAFQDFSKVLP